MIKNFYPAIFWTIIITVMSAAPGLPSFDWDLISFDKAAHLIVYAILAWLICWGFAKNNKLSYKNYLIAFVFSASWGMAMEWMQGTFFPHRFFEWPDEIANAIGAFSGAVFFYIRQTKKAQPIDNQ